MCSEVGLRGRCTALAPAHPDVTVIPNEGRGLLGVGLCAARKAERFLLWMRSVSELAIGPSEVAHPSGLDMLIFGFDLTLHADPRSSDRLIATWTPFTETCKTPSMCRPLRRRRAIFGPASSRTMTRRCGARSCACFRSLGSRDNRTVPRFDRADRQDRDLG